MAAEDAEARQALLDRLAQSRAEMRRILDPPSDPGAEGGAPPLNGHFPRSRTMRALLSSRGIGAVGALAGGLLIARPALALRMLRMVPVGTVGKLLIAKAIGALRARAKAPHEP